MADEGVNDDRIFALRKSLEHALEHRELLRRACERGLAALTSAVEFGGVDPAEHRVCREMRDALACTAAAPAGPSAALAAQVACEVSMDTAALHGLPQQLPLATLAGLARAHAALDRIEKAADDALALRDGLRAALEEIAETAREGRGP